MSARPRQQSLAVRKRLPWLDKPGSSSQARSDDTEVRNNATNEKAQRAKEPRASRRLTDSPLRPDAHVDQTSGNPEAPSMTQTITTTTQTLSHAEAALQTANSDGANSSSTLDSASSMLGSLSTYGFPEDGGRSFLTPAGSDVQQSNLPEARSASLGKKGNTFTITLDNAGHAPADKRSLLQMIDSLLRSELDLPLDDEPPPKDPRRLIGMSLPVNVTPVAEVQQIEEPDNDNETPHRDADGTSAPISPGEIPPWYQDDSLPLHSSPQDRRSTLAQLPPHLLLPSYSSSPDDIKSSSSWESSLSPDTNAAHVRGPLHRAVAGLENLMEEALHTARDAAKFGRSEDVAAVFNNATLALRKASTVRGMSQKLPSSSSLISSLDSRRNFAQMDSTSSLDRRMSSDTLPTVYTKGTKSNKPSFVSEDAAIRALASKPQQVVFDGDIYDMCDSSTESNSIASTPRQLYQTPSTDSVTRDFAYPGRTLKKTARAHSLPRMVIDSASSHDRDDIPTPTLRSTRSKIVVPNVYPSHVPHTDGIQSNDYLVNQPQRRANRRGSTVTPRTLQYMEPEPVGPSDVDPDQQPRRLSRVPPERSESLVDPHGPAIVAPAQATDLRKRPSTIPEHGSQSPGGLPPINNGNGKRRSSAVNERRYDEDPPSTLTENDYSKDQRYSDPSLALKAEDLDLKNPRRNHLSLAKDQKFSLGRYHKRRPIAREWSGRRKRMTATITCLNTVFIGLIAGIYAGEVPRIQYQIADQDHLVLYGNVLLFAGLGITTLFFWPLPLLHGRKPYISTAFALMLPLQFPQALAIASYRDPRDSIYRFGLLFPRVLTGLALGFANINFLPTLFDLYGASLMSKRPHQEIVVYDDVRRQGGGMGLWLGIWTFCFSSALAIGFCIGAGIIARLDPSWGFYIVVILLAFFLFINVIAPETRRSPYRRSIAHFYDEDDPEKLRRRVARGEVKLHISDDGPKWWYEEVWAGVVLTTRMIRQPGLFILMCYMGWIKAQLTLVILLLGALLSRDYRWRSEYVGLAVLAIPIGAIVALPLSKASCFSRSRSTPQRTDSMTFEPRLTWTSHLIQRVIFSLLLPLAAVAYCLTAPGPHVSWVAPVIFAGLIGFLTDLGIAECVGLIMETFDTCDLQPGVNTRHRLVSLDPTAKRRRTNYSSFPRVCAAFFAADALGFLLSAVATGVSGKITRAYGAQTAIAIVAGVLLAVTFALLAALWRWREVQVVPNYTAGTTLHGTAMWTGPGVSDPSWKPVIVGNPSGKTRRMNLLEMGSWSRWTEIRKLNGLIRA